MIICSDFKGTSGREAMATLDCNGTLFEQFDQAYQFIVSRLPRSCEIKEVRREERLEVPPVAIREALLNAIIHRNYYIAAPAKVAIYEDRIEIFSPGSLPGPLNLANLRTGITYLRNPAICKAFREAGLVEKLGSGLIAILDSYEEWGLATPCLLEGENYVKCILPRKLASPQGARDLLSLIDKTQRARHVPSATCDDLKPEISEACLTCR
jgi:ATP-dependent DNA helicase RecG